MVSTGGTGSASPTSRTVVGDAAATGVMADGSFGLGGMATTFPGAASSVFEGVAALMGLLFLRGVCFVRGDDILGERAAAFGVVVLGGWLVVIGVLMSMESDAIGLVVVVFVEAGGEFVGADFDGGSFGAAEAKDAVMDVCGFSGD